MTSWSGKMAMSRGKWNGVAYRTSHRYRSHFCHGTFHFHWCHRTIFIQKTAKQFSHMEHWNFSCTIYNPNHLPITSSSLFGGLIAFHAPWIVAIALFDSSTTSLSDDSSAANSSELSDVSSRKLESSFSSKNFLFLLFACTCNCTQCRTNHNWLPASHLTDQFHDLVANWGILSNLSHYKDLH